MLFFFFLKKLFWSIYLFVYLFILLLKKVMKTFEAAKLKLQEQEELMKEMKARHEKEKEEIIKFRKVEVDFEHKIEELEKQVKDNQVSFYWG